MRCHWVSDTDVPGGRYHFPGCMGAAVYGPAGCTCGVVREREDLEGKVERLELRVKRLEAALGGERGS